MNRSLFGIVVTATLVAGGAMVSVVSEVRGDAGCGTVAAAAGGFGNAGFAAGYSMSGFRGDLVSRGCGPLITCRPVCGPRLGGWCRPGWDGGWGWSVGCVPRCPPRPWCPPQCIPPAWSGSWCGPPAWNTWGWGGWYGGTTWAFRDSVFLSVPAGGNATFFSGALVPRPIYVGPPARPVIAVTPRAAGRRTPIRASTGPARLKAARLIARGDAQLREAGQDPARLEAALASYRQAATAAQDQPDALIRQAVVLEALDRREAAMSVLDQAVAVDGRLAAAPAGIDRNVPPDPIFDGRPSAELPPLAARGIAILQEIGAEADEGGEPSRTVAWLADRWSARWGRGTNAVAANGR